MHDPMMTGMRMLDIGVAFSNGLSDVRAQRTERAAAAHEQAGMRRLLAAVEALTAQNVALKADRDAQEMRAWRAETALRALAPAIKKAAR